MPGSSHTYFGNFVFGFSSLRMRDFLYNVFHCQGKMKWKRNKLSCNILVTSSPKAARNKVTKMGWNAHKSKIIPFHICQQHVSTKSANDFCEKYTWDFFRFSHDNWWTPHQISAADSFEVVSHNYKMTICSKAVEGLCTI